MTDDTQHSGQPQHLAQSEAGDAVVAAPDRADARDDGDDITTMVEQPGKVMRIGTMIKQLLEEVRAAPLDEAGRQRLREIHDQSIHELEDGLAPELRDELERFTLPFGENTPSEAELRIAQAQLVGWLEGLFHGIQTTLFAQQMAARAQLEEIRRRALPGAPGVGPGGPVIVGPGGQIITGQRIPPRGEEGDHSTGQYL
jgi:Bacterial proteasome activator